MKYEDGFYLRFAVHRVFCKRRAFSKISSPKNRIPENSQVLEVSFEHLILSASYSNPYAPCISMEMYGIFSNICCKNHPNVGQYTIRGAYGQGSLSRQMTLGDGRDTRSSSRWLSGASFSKASAFWRGKTMGHTQYLRETHMSLMSFSSQTEYIYIYMKYNVYIYIHISILYIYIVYI